MPGSEVNGELRRALWIIQGLEFVCLNKNDLQVSFISIHTLKAVLLNTLEERVLRSPVGLEGGGLLALALCVFHFCIWHEGIEFQLR